VRDAARTACASALYGDVRNTGATAVCDPCAAAVCRRASASSDASLSARSADDSCNEMRNSLHVLLMPSAVRAHYFASSPSNYVPLMTWQGGGHATDETAWPKHHEASQNSVARQQVRYGRKTSVNPKHNCEPDLKTRDAGLSQRPPRRAPPRPAQRVPRRVAERHGEAGGQAVAKLHNFRANHAPDAIGARFGSPPAINRSHWLARQSR
jgi:hypothetical protein